MLARQCVFMSCDTFIVQLNPCHLSSGEPDEPDDGFWEQSGRRALVPSRMKVVDLTSGVGTTGLLHMETQIIYRQGMESSFCVIRGSGL